jgi:streptogrisin C
MHRLKRFPRLAAVATSLLLGVSALALSSPSATATPIDAGKISPTVLDMADALQRDLGMSLAQARERLAAEESAARLEQTLMAQLGDRYAGSWVDDQDGQLAVAVTDAGSAEQVRKAGARSVLVAHSAASLDVAKQHVDTMAGDSAPSAVMAWYVDAQINALVLEVDAAASDDRSRRFVHEVQTEAAVPVRVVQSGGAPTPVYNVVGGDAFYIGDSRCSIGFSARTASGGKAFVTAGHCTAGGGAVYGANRVRMGSASGSTFGNGGDYGKVSISSDEWTLRPWVNLYDGRALVVEGSQAASVNAAVCRSGSTSGWRCGTISAKNVTVNYPGHTVTGLVKTSACAAPGDSGGPFMHNGQGQGMTSGINNPCGSSGATDTFYQPLNEALNAYNLRLVTG